MPDGRGPTAVTTRPRLQAARAMLPRRPSAQKPPLLTTIQPLQSDVSYVPSHAGSLGELEEEVEREALAATTGESQEEG